MTQTEFLSTWRCAECKNMCVKLNLDFIVEIGKITLHDDNFKNISSFSAIEELYYFMKGYMFAKSLS